MRKIFVVLLLFFSLHSIAQNTRTLNSGVKAGVNLSNLNISNEFEGSTDMRINFHAGIFYTVPFGSMFSLQPELLFSGEGADLKSSTSKTETRINYLSIPVMFQFNTTGGFLVETGPALGVLVRGKETITTSASTSELDLKKQIKKTNLSWGAGLGYKIRRVGINARYYFGLANLSKTSTRAETKTSLIQVGLSWSFRQPQ